MKGRRWALLACFGILAGCGLGPTAKPQPREVLFVGVDLSGSFLEGGHYEDAMDFLAHYLYARLHGLGGLEVPQSLFVGPIGGHGAGEAKTLFPIQSFEGKDLPDLRKALAETLAPTKKEPYTDYNAFLSLATDMVKSRNLVLRPLVLVMVTDGRIDMPGVRGRLSPANVDLRPLEKLSRNVSLRLLYTDPEAGQIWRNKVPRRRVKVWTQDASVMALWKDPRILDEAKPLEDQASFAAWVKDNVDFNVRARRVP